MSTPRRSYLLQVSEPHVMVPARVAALLERHTDIAALRVRARGVDPVASGVLEDIRIAAMSWAPVVTPETEEDEVRQPATRSEWLSCSEVAESLGISRQAVRKAIKAGRLEAVEADGKYRINRKDMEHYRQVRKRSA